MLDAVLEDAAGCANQVSTVRPAAARRVPVVASARWSSGSSRPGKAGRLQGWRPTLDKPDMPRPADGIPQDIDQHMRLMCDILVLAFRTDTTRVCTLKLNNDHSSLRFPHLSNPIRMDYMIHHLLSHTDGADWLKVNQFFTEQLAYIADKLDAVQEGERTLLDNSMILYCSSMMTGNHNNDQLPVVLLGRGGGQIKTGRVLDYLGQAEPQDVQPVPVADGQGRRAPRTLRRFQSAAGGDLEAAQAHPFYWASIVLVGNSDGLRDD